MRLALIASARQAASIGHEALPPTVPTDAVPSTRSLHGGAYQALAMPDVLEKREGKAMSDALQNSRKHTRPRGKNTKMKGSRRPQRVCTLSLARPTMKPSRKSTDLHTATSMACVPSVMPIVLIHRSCRAPVRSVKSIPLIGSRNNEYVNFVKRGSLSPSVMPVTGRRGADTVFGQSHRQKSQMCDWLMTSLR